MRAVFFYGYVLIKVAGESMLHLSFDFYQLCLWEFIAPMHCHLWRANRMLLSKRIALTNPPPCRPTHFYAFWKARDQVRLPYHAYWGGFLAAKASWRQIWTGEGNKLRKGMYPWMERKCVGSTARASLAFFRRGLCGSMAAKAGWAICLEASNVMMADSFNCRTIWLRSQMYTFARSLMR